MPRKARKESPNRVESGAETAQARSGELSIEARLLTIIEEAFEMNVSKDVIVSLVTQRFDSLTDAHLAQEEVSLSPEGEGQVVYEELPDGLIDLPSAARKYDINRVTLWRWADKGAIRKYGRLKASAAGGGYLVLNEEELTSYISAPRDKGGRPKKTL